MVLLLARPASADATREFLMSCTYGVLAGTLVGAATLAFTDKPGENLQAIARGASLGLYAGILLGVYVVYVVPASYEPPEDFNVMQPPRLDIYPTFDTQTQQIEGVAVNYRVLEF